jgi:hypothetical protein
MFNLAAFIQGRNAINPIAGGYDTIGFFGFLCKADSLDGKKYFTIDMNGNAISAYIPDNGCIRMNFVLDTPDVDVNDNVKLDINHKEDKVTVLRHFRYRGDKGQVQSHGGMTAVCILDYTDKVIYVYPSFCSVEDNFDKKIGTINAIKRLNHGIGFAVSLDVKKTIYDNIKNADMVVWPSKEAKNILQRPLDEWNARG